MALSVSTIGSYFLKLPRAEMLRMTGGLSVSTIGSYFLKHRLFLGRPKRFSTFSIHYWIVFLETTARVFYRDVFDCFQYPLLDRIS